MAVDDLLHDYFSVSRVLIVAPLRVAQSTWRQEAQKWKELQNLNIQLAIGTRAERIKALMANAEITVINRENVPWLVTYYGKTWPFDMLVIDELSSFRNPSAKRFRALRRVRPMIKRVVGLTGTPAPKGIINLWAQMYLLDQGERLGKTVTGYRDRWFSPGARNGSVVYEWAPKKGAPAEIASRISDICLSMRASDHIDMPSCTRIVAPAKLTAPQLSAYRQFEKTAVLPLEDETIAAFSAGAVSVKLRQYANGAVYHEDGQMWEAVHDAKLDVLEDLIEAANGEPVLVYYGFRHDAERIKKRFPQAVPIGGADTIDAWNAGRLPILLAHPASAGHGLNLQQGGSVIIWYGLTTDLELYQQANARLLRQGQTRPVRIYHIAAEGTHDEDCMPILDGRALRQNDLLNALKARAITNGR